jgi:hypothetical protein
MVLASHLKKERFFGLRKTSTRFWQLNIIWEEGRWVELKVASTPPSLSSLQDEVYKPATLNNGMQIQVPQFIKEGDVIKVDVNTKKYIERVKR